MSQLGIAGYSSHLHLHLGMPSTTKNTFFLGKYSQIWVGGVADSQTGRKKTKPPQKSPLLTRISPLVFPNLTKTPGWVHRFGKTFQKKNSFIFGGLP